MYQHQPLALVALVFAVGVLQLEIVITPEFCKNASSPQAIVNMAKWAGVCLPVTTAYIPSILTSWELHTLHSVTDKLPDPDQMAENRNEIMKISAGLAAIDTPESQLMVDAVEIYDDQAKAGVQSLAKLGYMTKLIDNAFVGSITGIIKTLEGFPRDVRRSRTLQVMIQSRQDAIDAWVRGLNDALKEFHSQTVKTLANLDACDISLRQIIRTSGRAQAQQQGNVDPTVHDWGPTLFGTGSEHIPPAALEAVTNLEALIRESTAARDVVGRLPSADVATLMTGIEAAKRYSDQMSTVEMTLDAE